MQWVRYIISAASASIFPHLEQLPLQFYLLFWPYFSCIGEVKSLAAVTGKLFRHLEELEDFTSWNRDQGKNKQQQEHRTATSWCKESSIRRPTTEKTPATALTRARAGLVVTTWTSATAESPSTARTQATAGRATADNFKINTFSKSGTLAEYPVGFLKIGGGLIPNLANLFLFFFSVRKAEIFVGGPLISNHRVHRCTDEIGGVYLPSQLECTVQLWW